MRARVQNAQVYVCLCSAHKHALCGVPMRTNNHQLTQLWSLLLSYFASLANFCDVHSFGKDKSGGDFLFQVPCDA